MQSDDVVLLRVIGGETTCEGQLLLGLYDADEMSGGGVENENEKYAI